MCKFHIYHVCLSFHCEKLENISLSNILYIVYSIFVDLRARTHTAHVYMWCVSYVFCTWCVCVGVWKKRSQDKMIAYLWQSRCTAYPKYTHPDMHTHYVYFHKYAWICMLTYIHIWPLTKEIRLIIFGSPDLSVFLIDLLTGGDSVYSLENSFEIFGTPMKTCLIFMVTTVKSRWIFWQ